MQNLAGTVASIMNIEVAIADKNLTRIVGTGDFYERIDGECPDDSLFATVIESGILIVNLTRNEHCAQCSFRDSCAEFANMSYPIKNEDETIGVISFASFDENRGIS